MMSISWPVIHCATEYQVTEQKEFDYTLYILFVNGITLFAKHEFCPFIMRKINVFRGKHNAKISTNIKLVRTLVRFNMHYWDIFEHVNSGCQCCVQLVLGLKYF